MSYIKFSRHEHGRDLVMTVRLDRIAVWWTRKEPILGPIDGEGDRPEIGETDRLVVSFQDPHGGDPIVLTPDQSDAFLRIVGLEDLHDLDAPPPGS